jgi:hypothetical protein
MNKNPWSLKAVSRLAAIAASAVSLSACAYVSQAPDGTASVVGLAAVTMQQTPGAPPGHVTVRSHGVTLSDTPPAQGLVVGVYDQQLRFGQQPVYSGVVHSRGDYDYVAKTRKARSGNDYVGERRIVKRVKYRKMRRCRCR